VREFGDRRKVSGAFGRLESQETRGKERAAVAAAGGDTLQQERGGEKTERAEEAVQQADTNLRGTRGSADERRVGQAGREEPEAGGAEVERAWSKVESKEDQDGGGRGDTEEEEEEESSSGEEKVLAPFTCWKKIAGTSDCCGTKQSNGRVYNMQWNVEQEGCNVLSVNQKVSLPDEGFITASYTHPYKYPLCMYWLDSGGCEDIHWPDLARGDDRQLIFDYNIPFLHLDNVCIMLYNYFNLDVQEWSQAWIFFDQLRRGYVPEKMREIVERHINYWYCLPSDNGLTHWKGIRFNVIDLERDAAMKRKYNLPFHYDPEDTEEQHPILPIHDFDVYDECYPGVMIKKRSLELDMSRLSLFHSAREKKEETPFVDGIEAFYCERCTKDEIYNRSDYRRNGAKHKCSYPPYLVCVEEEHWVALERERGEVIELVKHCYRFYRNCGYWIYTPNRYLVGDVKQA
jgi:hypothetical protein